MSNNGPFWNPDAVSNVKTRPQFRQFLQLLAERLEAGGKAYGDKSFDRPVPELLGELQQELLDTAGWGFVAYQRVQRLVAAARQMEDKALLEERKPAVKEETALKTDPGFLHDGSMLRDPVGDRARARDQRVKDITPREGQLLDDVLDELKRATNTFGAFRNGHEGYGVILEELEELWNEVKASKGQRYDRHVREEAVQVAAMAMRFALDLCDEPGVKGDREVDGP